MNSSWVGEKLLASWSVIRPWLSQFCTSALVACRRKDAREEAGRGGSSDRVAASEMRAGGPEAGSPTLEGCRRC
jgi:hypothetical protein